MSSPFNLYRALLGAAVGAMVVGFTSANSPANEPDPEPFVSKTLVIIKSTTRFQEAQSVATQAAEQLGVRLDLRDLTRSKKIGLTFSKADCEESRFPFPCYVARGRDDDGVYVSVEYSSAYSGFTKGLFVVVVASGEADTVRHTLERARRLYPDAYLKTTRIYIGCLH